MNKYLFVGAECSAKSIAKIYDFIPEARLNEHSPADRFSPREVAAHMADWEPILLTRLKGGAENEGFVITVYDESERAISEGYAQADVKKSLEQFVSSRATTINYCKTLTPEQLSRTMTHPELGPITVTELICMLCQHDVYHIEHLLGFVGDKLAATW